MLTWVVVVAVVALFGGAAFAQFAKTEDAVKYRQSAMFLIGQHFSRMGAVLKGEAPYDKEALFQRRGIEHAEIRVPEGRLTSPVIDSQHGLEETHDYTSISRADDHCSADGHDCVVHRFGIRSTGH